MGVSLSLTGSTHTTYNNIHSDSAQQVASELHKLQGELSVRLPYRRGALARAADKSLASIKAGAGGGVGGGPAGVAPAEGARKPDEAFEAQ